ncbi:MAG: PAS domain S-box protein [Acidovorax sp.]|nr:PAS domain S-box protein [Acidovorax sp.]
MNSGVHGPAFWGQMWQTVRSGRSWRQEVCNRAKDGSLYWVDSVVAPFIDAKGQIEKFVSIRADITERKRTQMELQRTLSLLRAVLEASTQVAIVATDARGVVSLLNRGAELLLGMQADAAVGHVNARSFLEQAPAEAGSGADGACSQCAAAPGRGNVRRMAAARHPGGARPVVHGARGRQQGFPCRWRSRAWRMWRGSSWAIWESPRTSGSNWPRSSRCVWPCSRPTPPARPRAGSWQT